MSTGPPSDAPATWHDALRALKQSRQQSDLPPAFQPKVTAWGGYPSHEIVWENGYNAALEATDAAHLHLENTRLQSEVERQQDLYYSAKAHLQDARDFIKTLLEADLLPESLQDNAKAILGRKY